MKTHSFMRRLLFSYLVIALIPLLVLMVILLSLNVKSVERDVQQNLDSVAELTSTQLEAVYNTMSFISLDIVADEEFMSAANRLNYGTNSLYEESTYYAEASNEICSYSYTSASYHTVFFNWNGHFMTSYDYNQGYTYQYRLPEDFLEGLEWLDTTLNNYGRAILLPVSASVLPNVEEEALTLVRAVRNPGDVIGFLAVQMAKEDFEQIFDLGGLNGMEILVVYGDSVLYQSEGFPVELSGQIQVEELLQEMEGEYLVSARTKEDSGLTTIMAARMDRVYERTVDTLEVYVLEALVIITLTIGVIAVMARRMSRPLVALSKEMQGMTLKNLSSVTNDKIFGRYSETKILHQEFVDMKQRLDVMINNEVMLKTLQTRERLHYLQSQINPHFLYNTLNIIGIMGAENGVDRIYDSCLKLSELMRYAISDKNTNTVSFSEEFNHIRMYLELMKLRFENRLTYDIQCGENLEKKQVLRLILQPFVENVFEHALDARHSTINISVRGMETTEGWEIVIEDNGAGMADWELRRMNEDIRQYFQNLDLSRKYMEQQDGIGVKNTLIRLYLYYDGAFYYSLENRQEGGFRVILGNKGNSLD